MSNIFRGSYPFFCHPVGTQATSYEERKHSDKKTQTQDT